MQSNRLNLSKIFHWYCIYTIEKWIRKKKKNKNKVEIKITNMKNKGLIMITLIFNI